jgi:prevent-host-death family protein
MNDMEHNNCIPVSEFKKHFLHLVDEVKNKHNSFIITKRKAPVAKIVPLEENTNKGPRSYFGFMKGTATIKDDIVSFSSALEWEACQG